MATAEIKLQKAEFANEPFVDFAKAENRAAMEEALKKVASEFGREYPMYIGGQDVRTKKKMKPPNPSEFQ
jgi:1-pyrroline-5-carboxylate dehydrogenase